jgi:inner membrane protein
MDNLTHTLVGAALGESGLKKRTGLGLAALMISANLPDLDAIGWLVGENLAWRRGWTHGPIALLLMPLLLAWALLAFDRWQTRRSKRPESRKLVSFRALLLLSYIGIFSHILFDVMNSYGVRWLMPFSDRWFTCNSLFIIDPWIWIVLGLGVWLSYRRDRLGQPHAQRPAIVASMVVTAYTCAMIGGSFVAERIVANELAARGLGMPQVVMASPVPINSLKRAITYRVGNAYGFGELRWTPMPQMTLNQNLVPAHMDDPAIAKAAAQNQKVADFLYWSRMPFADIERRDGEAHVTLGDARYNHRPGEGHFVVRATVKE